MVGTGGILLWVAYRVCRAESRRIAASAFRSSAARRARIHVRAPQEGSRVLLRQVTQEIHRQDRTEGSTGSNQHCRYWRSFLVRLRALLLLAFLVTVGGTTALAHEVRPGFLELRETGPETYSFSWRKPTGGEVEIQIAPVVPKDCQLITPDKQQLTPSAILVAGILTCKGGLAGKTIFIAGLDGTITDVLVRLHHSDGRLESHLLRPDAPSVTLGGVTTLLERALSYVQLGVLHILLGVDHLLFVLGLMLIVADRWMLVKTITAFTVAHSITLAIATLGYAQAPIAPLNAAIALSILFLGPEVVRVWRGETSFTIRHPWVVAFAFGLLHGFGFASGLTAMGLPRVEIPIALVFFNVGVEIGQLFFVFLILGLERSFRVLEIQWPRLLRMLPGYAVGTLGAFWTLQRTLAMLWGWG